MCNYVDARGFEIVDEEHLKSYGSIEEVIMPLRGTKHAAGYDFFLPFDTTIKPGETKLVWSDIKAFMGKDEVLKIYPRSSVAIKKGVIIKNIVGIIDNDYYNNSSNDGNIGICLVNTGDETQIFTKGTAICQAIFQKFLESANCNSDDVRTGGLGSTTK